MSQLWVLDTSPCALVGYHGNLGDIVDVSTAGHEIYVLQRGGDRLLMKLSLIPKLANPLVDVVALLEHSFKSDEEENTKQQQVEPKTQVETANKVTQVHISHSRNCLYRCMECKRDAHKSTVTFIIH